MCCEVVCVVCVVCVCVCLYPACGVCGVCVYCVAVWCVVCVVCVVCVCVVVCCGVLFCSPSRLPSTFAKQISLGPIALCEVSRPSKEDLNADATKNVGRDEYLVCALVKQGVNDASLQVHTCSSCSMMLSDCERILISFLRLSALTHRTFCIQSLSLS